MKRFYLVFLILASFQSYSQNYLFETKSSGYSVTGQLASVDGSTLIGVIPAYTSNGKFTMSLGIGYESNDELDLYSIAIIPALSYLIMKQGENNNPISVALTGAFQYNTFPDYDGLTGAALRLSGSLHHQINVSDAISLIPGAAFGWNRIGILQDGILLDHLTGIFYGFLGTVRINTFYIEPSITLSEGTSFLNLSFGMLFPQSD